MRILFVIFAVLLFVPRWAGEERVPLYDRSIAVAVTRVTLDPRDPRRTRVGALTFLGGIELSSAAAGFGGFSSIAVHGRRFTLLSDSGNFLRFRLGDDWTPQQIVSGNLPAGPGTGWEKRDRDSESLVIDPVTNHAWVGFESANAIWRYTADFGRADGWVRPRGMRRWPSNGGAEAMARLPDGRFLVLSEEAHLPPRYWRGSDAARLRTREGLIFAGDPVSATVAGHFAYVVDGRYDVSDATALPNGDLLVLERAFHLPYRFSTIVSRVAAADVRDGGIARPVRVAMLESPLIHDNFEGITTTREGGATMLWLVSDDNQSVLQRTLLLKFRLDR